MGVRDISEAADGREGRRERKVDGKTSGGEKKKVNAGSSNQTEAQFGLSWQKSGQWIDFSIMDWKC